MSVSAHTFAVGHNLASLDADIAAKIALGYQPNPSSPVQLINGQMVQSMITGSPTVTMIDSLTDATLTTPAGTGITTGTGTVYLSQVSRSGDIIVTRILIDLTGLDSDAAEGDIIGLSGTALPCHIGRITAAQNGTIFGGYVACRETPAGGEVDIDLYAATEGTGVTDGAVGSLTSAALMASAGDWTAATAAKGLSAVPAANDYLYLTVGTGSTPTAGTYTAGKFEIVLFGYDA